jgi:hypothetical protein
MKTNQIIGFTGIVLLFTASLTAQPRPSRPLPVLPPNDGRELRVQADVVSLVAALASDATYIQGKRPMKSIFPS